MDDGLDHLRTLSVPAAGKLLGLGKSGSYEAAQRGDLPVIKIGRKLRVPVVALEELLRGAKPKAGAP